jgi:ribosomal protein L11 methyltransferase
MSNSVLQNTNWLCLRLAVAAEYSDLAATALHEVGCQGVQIEDVDIRDRGEDADLVPREHILVTGYYEQRHDESQNLEWLRERLSGLLDEYSVPAQLEVEKIAAQDWAESWRENFPPLQIGPFLIAPSWEEIAPDDQRILIRIDPGLAFGTGQHPTTQMCLELLGEQGSTLDGKSLLDVGCGSGVLSIAAGKLGAKVTASDFDPHCTSATRENAALNEVEFEVVQAAGLDWCQAQHDFVVANLMSDLLISLVNEIARVAKDKSTLIVSGISSPRADDVENALHGVGFSTIEKREKDGEQRGEVLERWTAFVMKRNPKP